MSEFKVSVCIPIYNVEAYVQRCIESLLSQSLKDIEIIIVNDCTLDSSMEIVREYAAKDRRIKVVEHDVNHGLMMARRTAYMMAKGDYIAFCDSDDSLPADALELLYNEAIATGADIVSGTIEYVYTDGSRRRWINQLSYGTNQIAVYKSLLTGEFKHNLCSRLFHRELLQKHLYKTYENATNGEDGMLFYQVIQNAEKIVKIDSVVYNYYQNLQSSTNVRIANDALKQLVLFYNYVVSISSFDQELKSLSLRYSTYNVNEFALSQGYSRMKSIVLKCSEIPFLSIKFRLKYMNIMQNIRWYLKYMLSNR